MTGQPPKSASPLDEHRVSLPTGTLLLTVFVAVLVVIGIWSAAVAAGPWGMHEFQTGMAGIGITSIVAFAGVFVISPWKPRAVADWMTMWLAGTVFRLFATPIAAYLLYSALSPHFTARPYALAVSLAYLATLFSETAVLAKHMKTVGDQPSR